LLPGRDEERSVRLFSVIEHAERIAEAGRGMEANGCEAPRGLRIAVRHAHDAGFLQSQYEANPRVGGERVHQMQFSRARIAKDATDPLLDKKLKQGLLACHFRHYLLSFRDLKPGRPAISRRRR